jgi:ketosteroid isomerase-like protein
MDAVTAARELVETFLAASMKPDPVLARTFVADNVRITFTGGRRFTEPGENTVFNALRYAWVKKRMERTDVVAGASPDEAIVYNTGTLHGAWPDGTPFEGNRYLDRFVVSHGKIIRMDVWNDSAEIILARHGLAEDGIDCVPAAITPLKAAGST